MSILAMGSVSVIDVADGNGVVSVEITYAIGSSPTVPPGQPLTNNGVIITDMNGLPMTDATWQTTIPTVPKGKYLWTRTITTYANGDFSIAYVVGYAGTDGAAGAAGATITASKEQWYLSNSSSSLTGGSWSNTEPDEIPDGKYLWGRWQFTMSDGSTKYSDAVYRTVIGGLINIADETEKAIRQKVWSSDITNSINQYDNTTGASIRDRVTATETDLSGIHTTISNVQTTLNNKADGSTVTALTTRVQNVEDTADSHTRQISATNTRIDNIKLGTKNYIQNSETFDLTKDPYKSSAAIVTGASYVKDGQPAYDASSAKKIIVTFPTLISGREYVFSYDWNRPYAAQALRTAIGGTNYDITTTNDSIWHRQNIVFTANANTTQAEIFFVSGTYTIYIRHFQLELGNIPSDWHESPEDVEAEISSVRTIAEQTSDKFSWIVQDGSTSSSVQYTANALTAMANQIDLTGKVTFNSMNSTLQNRITTVESSASTANEKANIGLGMKVNYSAFNSVNDGEAYLHGYTNGVAADVDGYVYWNGAKRMVPKRMLNPNTIVPYYTTIYIVLRLASASSNQGTLYMVWYNSGWKYAITPTPTEVGGAWTWAEATDVVLGQFVEPSNDGPFVDAYLYDPPRNASHVLITGNNSYQYSKGAVDWVSTNGSTVVTAAGIMKTWTGDATLATTTIDGGYIKTHTIESEHLATDAIMSSNYTAITGSHFSSQGSYLDLANGNFYTPNFGVSAAAGSQGAYINGDVVATSGKIGGNDTNYWEIGNVYDYNATESAAIIGHGTSYIQSGNWQLSNNRLNTQYYSTTAASSGNLKYYKDTGTNTFYDVGVQIPTDFTTTAPSNVAGRFAKSFFYGRKYTGDNAPSLDGNWTYFYLVDTSGNMYLAGDVYEGGTKLSDKYALKTDVGSTYLPTAGGTVTGNLTVNGETNLNGKVTTTLQIRTNLGSTSAATFTGAASAIVAPGVTGTLGVGNGGTGKASWTQWGIVYASTTSALAQVGAGTSGQILKSNGSAAPGWVNQSSIAAGSAINDADGNAIKTTYRKLANNDFDAINVTDLNAGNLVVTGGATFTNGLSGNLTGNVTGNVTGDVTGNVTGSSTKVLDSGNSTATTFAYSKTGLTTTSWVAVWNNYELRAMSPANLKTTIGLGNVDNTADANKNVATAGAFTSAKSVTLTGDTTGTASSTGGWSVATTTKLFTGTLESDTALTTSPGAGKIRYSYNVSNPTGIFSRTDNSNAIITLNRHSGNYDSQIGFSSDGKIYYRTFSAKALDNTTTWRTIIDSSNYNSYSPMLDGTGATGTWDIGATKDGSGNTITSTYLKLSGGTMTGTITFNNVRNAISYTGTKATYALIKFIDNTNDAYGNGIAIGGGGLTVVGGGEAADAIVADYGGYTESACGGTEELALGSDGAIKFYTNAQNGVSSAFKAFLDGSGIFYPNTTNTGGLGLSNRVWANVYATTLHGKLDARTITIGKTDKSVDWSANVSWSQSEISDCASQSANGWMSSADKTKLDGITAGAAVTGVKGNSETTYRTSNVNITATNIGLGNLTNNKQVKGLASGTTSGHLVTWGSDGYTVADSGITKGNIVKSVASDSNGKLVLTYADDTTSDPIAVQFVATQASSVNMAEALNVNGTAVGGEDQPVYFNNQGKPATSYKIPKLNSATTGGTFYAPTAVGTSGQYLKSNGSGAPSWATFSKSTVGLGNVDNTADANKSVATAGAFTSAKSVTLTGDTTGTASSTGGWSITTKTDRISTVGDNRSTATTPNDYKNKIIFQGLKGNSYIDSPSSNTYSYLIGLRGWGDSSGGNSHELAFNDSGIYRRSGATTSWGNWAKIIDSSNYTDYTVTKTGTGASGSWGISITGSSASCTGNAATATTATTATDADKLKYQTTVSTDANIDAFLEANRLKVALWGSTSSPGVSNGILISGGYTSTTYGFQLAIDDDPTYYMALRQKGSINGTNAWSEWKRIPMGDGTGASGTWDISISGNAATATSATTATTATNLSGFTNTTTSGTAIDSATQNGHVYVTGTSGIYNISDGAAFVQAYSTSWVAQIYQDYRTGQIALRGKNNGTWQAWRKVLDSSNYTDYTVTKTGTGASGTWGISISGNAATATNATNSTYLTHKSLDSTTIENTAGTFAFSGSGLPWDGTDWVGLQVGDSVDKFQISAKANTLMFRQNDNGGTNTTWSDWVMMLTSANYTDYAVAKTGGAFTGAVTGTSFAASSYLSANSGNSGTAGGLVLFNTNPTAYGIAMRQTNNSGKHGYVQGDWAIYSYMSGTDATNKLIRGWILKNATDNVGVASVSGGGHAVFNGSVTVGGNTANTSGMRMEYDSTLQCTNFIFN